MPRGKKKLPLEEQIRNVKNSMAELTAELAKKKKLLKELEKAQKEEMKEKLAEAASNSGKSLEEIIQMLQG